MQQQDYMQNRKRQRKRTEIHDMKQAYKYNMNSHKSQIAQNIYIYAHTHINVYTVYKQKKIAKTIELFKRPWILVPS